MTDSAKPANTSRSADHPAAKLDPAGWADEYGDYLFRYAKTRLRDDQSAEDAVQETFVAALRHVDQYAGAGAERAWLLGILKRKIVDIIRKRVRDAAVSSGDDDDPTSRLFDQRGHWKSDPRIFGRRPDASLEQAEFWAILRACLEGLPQRQADVFALRELEGQSTEEICKELGVTASNLWVLLYRARMRLGTCLKSRWK